MYVIRSFAFIAAQSHRNHRIVHCIGRSRRSERLITEIYMLLWCYFHSAAYGRQFAGFSLLLSLFNSIGASSGVKRIYEIEQCVSKTSTELIGILLLEFP